MCLNSILTRKEFLKETKIIKHKKNKQLCVGWKIIKIKNGKIKPSQFSSVGKYFELGKWINEKDLRPNYVSSEKEKTIQISQQDKKYRIGFHILITDYEAKTYAHSVNLIDKDYKIVKVYYKKAIAYGIQNACHTVISKEIYIPRQTPFSVYGNRCKKRLE